MRACFVLLFFLCACRTVLSEFQQRSHIQSYLQTELAATAHVQQKLIKILHEKHIPVGMLPRTQRHGHDGDSTGSRVEPASTATSQRELAPLERITVCDPHRPVECRVQLGPAEPGAVCVAPCGCVGTNKWVQWSVYNQMRRADPAQWQRCQTCLQPFDHAQFSFFGGVRGGLVSVLLDRPVPRRALLTLALLALAWGSGADRLLLRSMTSKFVWQMYPRWAKLLHQIPLPLQLWLLKCAVVSVAQSIVRLETVLVKVPLVGLETRLVEQQLEDAYRHGGADRQGGEWTALENEDRFSGLEDSVDTQGDN